MDLFVGRQFFDVNERAATRYLVSHGADQKQIKAINPAEKIASFDLLNSVTLFTDHVIILEGYSEPADGYQALEDGRFRLKSMPVWEESNWMPFEFDAPGLIEKDAITWVGSCHSLLRELDDIAARSPLPMAKLLPHYKLKPGGPDLSFDGRQLSDDELVRWVWRCLHDGAQMAIRQNSILSGTPE